MHCASLRLVRHNLTPAAAADPRLPSPRLAPELLGHVMGYVQDSQTMKQCCLAGPALLPHAQRVLYAVVQLVIERGQTQNNLERMLECYSTRPYASYARRLVIERRLSHSPDQMWPWPDLRHTPELLDVIAMLFTCQLEPSIPQAVGLNPAASPAASPASKITSLDFIDVISTLLDFARIIRAFPALLYLKCRPGMLVKNPDDDDDMRDFLASAPPAPRLLSLDMDGVRYQDLEPILFPPEAQLRLRSLSVSH